MNHLKGLAIAAAMAAALLVIAGTGSASATVICKTKASPCASPYTKGTVFNAVLTPGTTAVFKAGFMTIECTEGSGSVEMTNNGSATETVKGITKTLSFGGCNAEFKVLKTGTGEIHWTSKTNGSFTGEGMEVTGSALGVDCIYGGKITSGITLNGGEKPTISINAKVPKISGSFLCSDPGTMTASLTVTEPTPLYVLSS
ncbi:MAG TPA: hypothetical protein VFM51_09685 [Solirubrobacterales bacterium]|nr:hypothetical protein [Solirubrobacterales bacterium]